MATLTEVVHHVRLPQRCNRCRARVYRYSDEVMESGALTGRHFCSVCTRAVETGAAMSKDDSRPYSPEPVKVFEQRTITWKLDQFPTSLAVIRQGLREWADHPVFDEYPPDTTVSWAVSREEGRVDMTLEFRVFDNTDAHLNAALLDGDDARYEELLADRDREA